MYECFSRLLEFGIAIIISYIVWQFYNRTIHCKNEATPIASIAIYSAVESEDLRPPQSGCFAFCHLRVISVWELYN